jgi:hypothetical protein
MAGMTSLTCRQVLSATLRGCDNNQQPYAKGDSDSQPQPSSFRKQRQSE